MIYEGIDRWNYDYNSLGHFKYIKKIGNRYFYTPEELRAYYNADKKAANLSRIQANARVDARVKLAEIHPGMDSENKAAYRMVGKGLKTYNNIKAEVQPVVRTAKLATGAKSKKSLVTKAGKSLIKKRGMMTVGKLIRKLESRENKKKERYKKWARELA